MDDQRSLAFDQNLANIVGYAFMGTGFTLVATSSWALGWVNTFLGNSLGCVLI